MARRHRSRAAAQVPQVGREMDRHHGYCPEVLERRKALILPDVCASPRFSSNPVVDHLGIRTYIGAPLIDDLTGTTLGTICALGPEPRPLESGRAALNFIKERRDELMKHIYCRAGA
ncbi:GAF domain-containing protein [Streptomyces sp. NPDC020681]|uniref:GAF domain-containing protein n=1 Tax=Streptomyces sp. NPDC020681 TaxID=3365083 RepID=UPI0037AD0F38